MILDIRLPDIDGLELVRRLHERCKTTPIILMTGFGTAEIAIKAMQLGAFEYVLKPIDPDELIPIINRALESSKQLSSMISLGEQTDPSSERETLIGRSPKMQEVFKAIGRVAPLDVPVLILGESGTGKEMIARGVYQFSKRVNSRFLAINCAAIPEQLLESELFGHEKGAFTGADRRRCGKFEQCDGGTLFLDEIGDMPLTMQSKMLRVLQSQEFERVGGNETIRTNVRIIAATHQNLEQMIAEGKFRQDLYYRLAVCTIHSPPLRERKQDIPLLVNYFLNRYRGELHKEVIGLAEDVIDQLEEYHWPGNVRELQSAIKQAMVRTPGTILLREHFPASITNDPSASEDSAFKSTLHASIHRLIKDLLSEGQLDLYKSVLEKVERQLLDEVLSHSAGNLSKAARILGISRPTLRTRLAALHEDVTQPSKSVG